ncbi:TfoX/Sxy family protein [bacterium]|nr:TfoX/Sxy family protein [bacterium]MCI0606375.1 TfoX/Sxy family protein [bacterium]
MTDNELTQRVRAALQNVPQVVEKKMFGGVTFMVNGKMCVGAGKDRLMCRIDPAIHEKAVKRKGCRTVMMKGREYKGYVHVSEEGIRRKDDFDYWIQLALEYNKKAKRSKKIKKK